MTRSTRLLLCVAAAALLAPASASAVVGGTPAPPGRWPFMAAIVAPGAGDAFGGERCGATVIAPRRVLTAAHCVLGSAPAELQILVGRTRLSQAGGRRIAVTGIAVFPGFAAAQRQELDAAVLMLAEDAGVPPVRLATAADAAAWAPGAPAWVAGWGQLNGKPSPGDGFYYADRLREVRVPMVGDDACEGVYGGGSLELTYRPQYNLCAGGSGTAGGCYGDSGGPLAVETPGGWLQVGIVQSGDGCAAAGYFDLFARVDRVNAFAQRAPLTLQPWATAGPRLRGRLKTGVRASCTGGEWANTPKRFLVSWYRIKNGVPLVDIGPRHRVTAADAAAGLVCSVTGTNAGGYYEAFAIPRMP